MKTQLITMRSKLESMQDKASDLAGSENENTADKYGDIESSLCDAIAALTDAIDRFDS